MVPLGVMWLGVVQLRVVWLEVVPLGAVWLGAVWLGVVQLGIEVRQPIAIGKSVLSSSECLNSHTQA